MREGLIRDIENVIDSELIHSYDKFPAFNSAHEGYAVIKEEVEESTDELKYLVQAFKNMWICIKNNEIEHAKHNVKCLGLHAKLLACEASQAAAMADKFIKSSEGWK